jgi:hypothetical protein
MAKAVPFSKNAKIKILNYETNNNMYRGVRRRRRENAVQSVHNETRISVYVLIASLWHTLFVDVHCTVNISERKEGFARIILRSTPPFTRSVEAANDFKV